MDLDDNCLIDDKYRVVRLIGEGGMGAVYEGENIRIHRRVAIKVLHHGVAQNSDAVARFEREAQAAGRIGSEHIVEVLDLGDLPNGDRFMVMEFLEGESLAQRVRARGRITPKELSGIAVQILEGLAAAHEAQIIHRDLKPDNIFLLKKKAQQDFVKIVDFGISKFAALSTESGFQMTRTGAVMGTPYYLSPEQAKGAKEVDHRADLYAVGVILYECVTGRVPFDAETFNGLIMKIAFEEPERPEVLCADVDAAFGSIIAKAMARLPGERFQSATAMRVALERWIESGAKVTVPPSATLQVTSPGIPAPPAVPQFGSSSNAIGAETSQLAGTAGTWAASSPGLAAPPKSKLGLVVGAAAAGTLLIGGIATALLVRSSSAAPAASAAPVEESAATAAPAAPAAEAPAPVQAPSPAASAEAPAPAGASEAPVRAPVAKAATTGAGPAATTAAGAPKPTATSTPKTAPAATAGGRKVRTEL